MNDITALWVCATLLSLSVILAWRAITRLQDQMNKVTEVLTEIVNVMKATLKDHD
jgi:uncharacterized coiled-coil protein SlyX